MVLSEQITRKGLLSRALSSDKYSGRVGILIERFVLANSRDWLIFIAMFTEPVFYLLACQFGFVELVGEVVGPGGHMIGYMAFVAPAMMAQATIYAMTDSAHLALVRLRCSKFYDAVIATSVGPWDIALSELSWAVMRGFIYSLAFFGIMATMGWLSFPGALLLFPAILLSAFTFASIGLVCATYFTSSTQLDNTSLIEFPMILLSATFFPLSVCPEPIQVLMQCLPLYHGVELMRGISVNVFDINMLGHIGYLLIVSILCACVATRRLEKILRN